MDYSARTHDVPTKGTFEKWTDDARQKEQLAYEALSTAHDESMRQYGEVEKGIDPACDDVGA